MIILDENILDGQRLLLEAQRLGARQIGFDLGHKGLKDEEIIVLLRRQRHATFFTRDADFYEPRLRHSGYCIVVADVRQNEVAAFVRRFLRHPDFDTQMKRMGRLFGFRMPGWLSGGCSRRFRCIRFGIGGSD